MSEAARTTTSVDQRDDPRVASTLVIGVVGSILVLVTIVVLEVLFYRAEESEAFRKQVDVQPVQLRSLESEQRRQLEGYGWIDEQGEVVSIPIERAMELVVDEARRASGGD